MKRIAIFMDGTWQRLSQPDLTNIAKLAQSVAHQDADDMEQIVFYNRGVGARGETMLKPAGALAGGMLGSGLEDALLDAYLFLAWNYQPGDKIYIFGFSRGAFSARSLGGMINKCGILKRSFADLVHDAYKLYRDRKAPANGELMKSFRAQRSAAPVYDPQNPSADCIDIEYMGIFDTVGQRGLPSSLGPLTEIFNNRYAFHDLNLGAHVRSARHAVALDEIRRAFPVTPWENLNDLNAALGLAPNAKDAPYQQRWFPGAHGDVGGGCGSDISNLSLRWVADGAVARGLRFDETKESWLGILSDPENQNPCADFSVDSGGMLNVLGKRARVIRKLKRKERFSDADMALYLSDAAVARWRNDMLSPLYRPRPLKNFEALLAQLDNSSSAGS